MVGRVDFRNAAELAVQNVISHGDTDIFPFSFEQHSFYDKKKELLDLIVEYDTNFDDYINRFPPYNVNSLVPVTYTGFRWATQIDPIWNLYFLTCVISICDKIEEARLDSNTVFSYRFKKDAGSGGIFDRNVGWRSFMEKSLQISADHKYVVSCDISEFYPRLGHHRLENALKQVAGDTQYPKRIMEFLSNFSNTNSFGLPIGGPAARILSELTINQVDRLLRSNGVEFVRFADDYHLFANSREEAYRHLIFLSEKLLVNQGLALQKSKTRIMTAAEFKATNVLNDRDETAEPEVTGEAAAAAHRARQLLHISLRFDPYSPTADKDYERLKAEIKNFDVIGLLRDEIKKSRIHMALAKKIISAIRFLDGKARDNAVLSLLENFDVLYPVFGSVLLTIETVINELGDDTKKIIVEKIHELIKSDSHVVRVDVYLCFAIRVLSKIQTPENMSILQEIYRNRSSALIRRDIILVMAKWGEWYWLSDLKNRFRELTSPERRAFIVASYRLKDEGGHWRDHLKSEFNPFEKFVLKWAGEKAGNPKWSIPL